MLAVGVVLALVTGSAVGSPDSTAYWLDEIVVTATRSGRVVARIPISVSAITAPEIRASNARSFADLLDGLPGVSVQRTGDFGRSDPIIRGLGDNGKRLLVLVDGRPEKMALRDGLHTGSAQCDWAKLTPRRLSWSSAGVRTYRQPPAATVSMCCWSEMMRRMFGFEAFGAAEAFRPKPAPAR